MVIRGKSKETFDPLAVFRVGPGAKLLLLSRVCSKAFLCDHMSEVRNPFLEDKTLLWLKL